MESSSISRRGFLEQTTGAGAAVATASLATSSVRAAAQVAAAKKIRVGLIGCGSVSGRYLPNLAECPFAEVVSVCDIIPERAASRAAEFRVPNQYPHVSKLLAGAPFDLLVNTTDMQEHEHLNRKAIDAGKHIWSEKPIANSLAAGQEILEQAKAKGVRVWGAPVVVCSPQFAFMSKMVQSGILGRLASAHANYGHTGPTWSAFFYEKGGGSMPDLGVYNLTSLTGLFGPAKSVTAMVSIVTPKREIVSTNDGKTFSKKSIVVTEEDNAMVLLDHGNGMLSHVQCGFNFFNPYGHEGSKEQRHTIGVFGSEGYMGLVGYDWEPLGVDLATQKQPEYERHVTDAKGYVWQDGAARVCECLATGKEPPFTPEHALHVVEIIVAARESQRTGRRIELSSTFKWPIVV
jgi:predicted dehydrogenase